jgi:hypothetical protein
LSEVSTSAAAVPAGTATTTTATAMTIEMPKASHIARSAHIAPNQSSVVPCQGITVGNRLVLKAAAPMMASGARR